MRRTLRRVHLALLLSASVGSLAVCAGACTSAAVAADAGCSNREIREAQNSAHLADCRAYELVSPVDKNFGNAFQPTAALVLKNSGFAAVNGDRFAWTSQGQFADDPSAQLPFVLAPYAARRTPAGWITQSIRPLSCGAGTDIQAFPSGSPNNAKVGPWADRTVFNQPEDSHCVVPPLVATAPTPQANPYYAQLAPADPGYRLLAPVRQPNALNVLSKANSVFAAASDDYSDIVYISGAQQTPDAPAPPSTACINMCFPSVFAYHDGTVELVSRDTADIPFSNVGTGTVVAGANSSDARNAVSASGERIYFQRGGNPGSNANGSCNASCQLYLRESYTVTYDVSASECTVSCTALVSADVFQWASTAGDRAYFTSSDKLTDGTVPAGANLYLYRHSDHPGSDPHNLTLVTRDDEPADGTSAGLVGVLGASDDGDTVYFAASGQLVAGKPTAAGRKLYRWRWNGGSPQLDYLATLANGAVDNANWDATERRVSPSGQTLLVETNAKILPAADADTVTDVYRWTEVAGWTCVSCQEPADPGVGPSNTPKVGASGTSAANAITNELATAMSDDGDTVFFNSPDALVPSDANGPCVLDTALLYYPCNDVYQWHDGQLSLVTPGTTGSDNGLIGTSASGEDVFFFTSESLVGWDTDGLIDIYDASADGGFSEPPSPGLECVGDACQGAASGPPAVAGTGSGSFRGRGNVEVVRSTISFRALSSSDRSILAKGGKARLRVRVNGSGTVTVAGMAKVGKRKRRVVSSSARARKAGSVTVLIALSKSARSELKRRRSLTVSLTVRFKDARPKAARFTLRSAGNGKGGAR